MKDIYSFFKQNTQDKILQNLLQTYLEYYKIKKEFIENKDIFIKDLQCDEETINTNNIENKEQSIEVMKEDELKKYDKDINNDTGIKNIENQSKKHTNETITQLYHKLLVEAHPDKKKYNNTELFEHITKAYRANKIAKLCFLAIFLHIPIGNLTDIEQKEIEVAIEKKKKKIEHYQKTYPVCYARAESQELKDKILSSFKETL